MTLAEKAAAAIYLQDVHRASERHACELLAIHRNTKRAYVNKSYACECEQQVIELSLSEPRWGYRKVYDRLKLDGVSIGRETVRLIRKREGLQVRRKQHKKHYPGTCGELTQAEYPHHVWCYDFVFDATYEGRRLKCLTIVDEYSRWGLKIACARSMTASVVKRVLEDLFAVWGRPFAIRSDNGPEFIAQEIKSWLKAQKIETRYIEPGSPWQNGYAESFNSIFRDDCLNRWEFYTVREARTVIEQWLRKYNEYRPHGSLKGKTPKLFLEQWRQEQSIDKAA